MEARSELFEIITPEDDLTLRDPKSVPIRIPKKKPFLILVVGNKHFFDFNEYGISDWSATHKCWVMTITSSNILKVLSKLKQSSNFYGQDIPNFQTKITELENSRKTKI